MKKVLLLLTVLVGSIFLWNYAKGESSPVRKIVNSVNPKPIIRPAVTVQQSTKQYLFVPYWSFSKKIDANGLDSVIYFGIGVNDKGIEVTDKGYENLSQFVSLAPKDTEKILAVRMVDKNINANVIKNLLLEENIASQAVSLAQKNYFKGVLLDYETSAFGFDSTTKNITSFYKIFSRKVHESNLQFYVTLYGDTYFRARPYDVHEIGNLSDKIFIMAYDFSKSSGNPGPDFPLSDRAKYGYDFEKMIADFQKDTLNEKIVVTLGYFGYDWRVDSQGIAVATGVTLSLNEITKEFIGKCQFKSCVLTRSKESGEPSIKYVDDSGATHIVWFEDQVSINKKVEFLKTKGITNTADWAYSYY